MAVPEISSGSASVLRGDFPPATGPATRSGMGVSFVPWEWYLQNLSGLIGKRILGGFREPIVPAMQ